MARGSFSKEQKLFLVSKVPAFREAQQNTATPAFFPVLYLEYFQRWPVEDEGNDADTEGVDPDSEPQPTMQQQMMQRLKNWFYNCRIGKVHTQERPTVIDLTKGSKRKLQPYQAYIKLHNAKIKPDVEAKYQEKLRDHREGDKVPARLGVLIEEAKLKLEKETPEVKAEVEQFILHGDGDDATADKESSRKRAIASIPKTIQRAAENIDKATGWVMSVMLGGIAPDSGEIMTYVYHYGKTLDSEQTWDRFEPGFCDIENSFNQFLSHVFPQPEEKPRVLNVGKRTDLAVEVRRLTPGAPSERSASVPSSASRRSASSSSSNVPHRSATTGPAIAEERAVPSHPPSVASDSPGTTAQPEEPSPSPSEDESLDETAADPEAITSPNKVTERTLTFDEERDLRIQANNRLFDQLGLRGVALGIMAPKKTSPGGKKKGMADVVEPQDSEDAASGTSETTSKAFGASLTRNTLINKRPHSSTVSPSPGNDIPSSPSSITNNIEINPKTPIIANDPPTPVSTAITNSGPNGHVTSNDATPGEPTTISGLNSDVHVSPLNVAAVPVSPLNVAAVPVSPLNVAAVPVSSVNAITVPDPSVNAVAVPAPPPDGSFTGRDGATRSAGTSVIGVSSPNINAESHLRGSTPSQPSDTTRKSPSIVTPFVLPSQSQPADIPDPNTDDRPPSASASQEGTPQPEALMHVTLRALPDSLPDFVRHAAHYFLALSSNGAWHRTVSAWVRLEEALGYPGNEPRLPTVGRPEEVAQFIRSRRQYSKVPVLTTAKLRPYAASWTRWWKALQPKERGVDQWPFSRGVNDAACDWAPLLQGGPNGLYLVIASLGWWLVAASRVADEKVAEWTQVQDAVSDVEWVFERLLLLVHGIPSAQKRAGSEVILPNPKKTRHN